MTAVEEDKILPRNPCRVRGAGDEHAPERPVLTVAQVFELAERVGRRPVGNIRRLPDGGYRLRFAPSRRDAHLPRGVRSRADAERALWKMMAMAGPTVVHDRRYRALVLLATFASLRWGEATALRRCDLDLGRGACGYAPPTWSARPGRWCSVRPSPEPDGASSVSPTRSFRRCVSTWPRSSPMIRARWSSRARWAVRCGAATSTRCPAGRMRCGRSALEGLHFHDLRHTGNQFAAGSGRGAQGSDGADGSRQRACRDDLPARGPRS